ncbi:MULTISPECIES: hypothetical protein [unclassified Caballeronia]|uniref:hypothetical protein n=1 Tax=unclassified Caballeronia TaxID=2646786 RepID=UPI0020281CC9|nr:MULTISPECIES: hypothetical protein [unclassified Caballeronia]MDR5768088.1 hypothetical protein [Caballeronia sp. LZ028]
MKSRFKFNSSARPLPTPLREAPGDHLVWYFLRHPFRLSFAFQGALRLIIEAPSSRCLHISLEKRQDPAWVGRELSSLETTIPRPEYHVTACRHIYTELLEHKAFTQGTSWPIWSDDADGTPAVYACTDSLGRYIDRYPPELADGISAFNAMCSEWKANHNLHVEELLAEV